MGKHGTNYDEMYIPRCDRCDDTGVVLATREDGPPYDIHTGERRMKPCPKCNAPR